MDTKNIMQNIRQVKKGYETFGNICGWQTDDIYSLFCKIKVVAFCKLPIIVFSGPWTS